LLRTTKWGSSVGKSQVIGNVDLKIIPSVGNYNSQLVLALIHDLGALVADKSVDREFSQMKIQNIFIYKIYYKIPVDVQDIPKYILLNTPVKSNH